MEVPKFKELNLELKYNIVTITLNTKLNLFTPLLFQELAESANFIQQCPEVRVVILINAKESVCFSGGIDLKQFSSILMKSNSSSSQGANKTDSADDAKDFINILESMQNPLLAFRKLNVPVIAAIDGDVIGAGLDLISYCDIRIATSRSKVSLRETKLAIVADIGSLQRLPKLIGNGKLRWMAFTGGDFDAKWCKEALLFDEVVEDRNSLDEKVKKIAIEISQNSPLVIHGVKKMLNYAEYHSLNENLEMVKMWNASFLRSEDLNEAILSFLQKRKPIFKNRL